MEGTHHKRYPWLRRGFVGAEEKKRGAGHSKDHAREGSWKGMMVVVRIQRVHNPPNLPFPNISSANAGLLFYLFFTFYLLFVYLILFRPYLADVTTARQQLPQILAATPDYCFRYFLHPSSFSVYLLPHHHGSFELVYPLQTRVIIFRTSFVYSHKLVPAGTATLHCIVSATRFISSVAMSLS